MRRRLLLVVLVVGGAGCSKRGQEFQPLPVSNRPIEALAPPSSPTTASRPWPPPLPPAPPAVKPPVPPPPAPTTLNGDPDGPSADALSAVIQGAMPSLQACVESAMTTETEVRAGVSYQVTGDGKATNVSATGAVPAEALGCMKRAVEGLRFPTFKGAPVGGSLPVVVGCLAAPPPR